MVGVLDFLGLGDSDTVVEGPTYGTDDTALPGWSVKLDQGVAGVTPSTTSGVDQVFMAYKGDNNSDASRYIPVTKDSDGDLVFSFVVDQDILNEHKVFVRHFGDETLKRVPTEGVIIDDELDIRVRVDAFATARATPPMMASWRKVPKEQVSSGNPVFNYSNGVHRFFDGANWTVFAAPRLDDFGSDFFYTFA